MGVLPTHIAWIVPTETIKQVSSLLELELQRLWVTMWALGTKPGSSSGAASALNHWAEGKFYTCQSVSNHKTWRGLSEASSPLYSGRPPHFFFRPESCSVTWQRMTRPMKWEPDWAAGAPHICGCTSGATGLFQKLHVFFTHISSQNAFKNTQQS